MAGRMVAKLPKNEPVGMGRVADLLLESTGVGIYGLDLQGNTTFVNRTAARLLGWDAEDLIGKPQHELIHHSLPDGRTYERHDCPIYAAFTDGTVHTVDNEVFWRKDGTALPVEYVSTPILDSDGELIGAVVTFHDIGPRKAAEEALGVLQRQTESILRSAGEGIYGLDCQGNTTFANPAAAEMLGWKVEELVGRPQHEIIHHTHENGDPYLREDCPIYAAFTKGVEHREENEVFWRKDGTCLSVEYFSAPLRDEAGVLTGAVVTFIDITERKRQQKALESALNEVRGLKDRLEQENQYLQREIQLNHNFEEIIGASTLLKKTLKRIEKVAVTDATVLITGETGVGKELFTRALHHISRRRARPLVKVNCATLPANLIESELFGHEKGAFTGATARRIGRFELADGGTLFLDEIGELPLSLQAKLLRVLQEGEFERIGGARTITVDVRIIAATNRDLMKAVWAGEFRDDLFYRLNVFPVEIPSLRERRRDIPLLVTHFVAKYAAKMAKPIDAVPRQVQDALVKYDWPGNIRELENIIERGVILATDSTLRIDEALEMRPPERGIAPDRRTLQSVESEHILHVLEQTAWRIEGPQGAALVLDLHPNTLRSRMKKLGIEKRVGRA